MNTKISVIIGLFVFWSITTALLTASFVVHENQKMLAAFSGKTDVNATSTGGVANTQSKVAHLPKEATVLTLGVVAKHSTQSDCWTVISGSVYDITTYIPMHPGGVEEAVKFCGADGTKGFQTKDQNRSPKDHSSFAYSLLSSYFVGRLGDTIGSNTTSSSVVNKPTGTKPTGSTPATNVPNTTTSPSGGVITPTSNTTQTTLTLSEVSKHNTEADCWLQFGTKVYAVSAYISQHPGGKSQIIGYCGKGDAQPAFDAVGHSTFASSVLGSYYIGDIGTIVSTPSTQTNPTPIPSGVSVGDDDEDDD